MRVRSGLMWGLCSALLMGQARGRWILDGKEHRETNQRYKDAAKVGNKAVRTDQKSAGKVDHPESWKVGINSRLQTEAAKESVQLQNQTAIQLEPGCDAKAQKRWPTRCSMRKEALVSTQASLAFGFEVSGQPRTRAALRNNKDHVRRVGPLRS